MVGSAAPSGIGSIGSSGLSSFNIGGIAPNGGGPAPTGTGSLGAAGLSPIGSSGLTAFGLDGPSEAAKLGHYDSLVQQTSAQLAANQQRNTDLSRSIAEMGPRNEPPALTMQPIEPPHFAPPPAFPTFTLPPPSAHPAPLPAPPTFANQPLDAAGFTSPAPTAPTFTLSEAAGGPAPAAPKPAAPFTPFAMAPDALASPVTRPDIAVPPAAVDPFAPIAASGLGLTPPAGGGLNAFAVPMTPPTEEPGFFERLGGRIGDNFAQAFSTPLGPGESYRSFMSPLTTPTGYETFDALAQPIYNGALIGVPTFLDAVGRTIGATYGSLVDGGTELLASAGMDPSNGDRLGRDLKAMPEAFAGSPGSIMRPTGFASLNAVDSLAPSEGPLFRSLGPGGQTFDPAKLTRIQAALEKQGVSFVMGEEGARLARALGGEAIYFPAEPGRPGIMAFGPNPSRTQVIEELIHYGQHKAAGFGNVSERIASLEIQAQNKLLQIGPRLGWEPEELSQIERALAEWQKNPPIEK